MSTFADDLKNKGQNQPKGEPLNEHEAMERSFKHMARALAIVFGIFFAGLTSCGITAELTEESDGRGKKAAYEGQATLAEANAKVAEANAKEKLAQVALTEAQNESIVDLIKNGTNPIAARCAIIGWETDADRQTCLDSVILTSDIKAEAESFTALSDQ